MIDLNTFLARPDDLLLSRDRLHDRPDEFAAIHDYLGRQVRAALQSPVLRVTDKRQLPPSGDARDYFSFGTYWWPDPERTDGLPWVRRDGEINPDSMHSDTGRVRKLCQRIWHLALGWLFLGDARAAEAGAEQLRAWFLDPQHAMRPHLRYAQAIPGRVEGRSHGIIDTRDFRFVCDAASILLESGAWKDADHAALQVWMGKFLDWLLESAAGRKECDESNNHGTWYSAQVLAIALFCGRMRLARELAEGVSRRIDQQIDGKGFQAEEFKRSRPLTYCSMNLQAFFDCACLAESAGLDLWHYRSDKGGSLEKACDWLLPYLMDADNRIEREIVDYQPENYLDLFQRAARQYGPCFRPEALALDTKRVVRSIAGLLWPAIPEQRKSRAGELKLQQQDQAVRAIARHWGAIDKKRRTRWWNVPAIVQEINLRVCGEPINGVSQGSYRMLKTLANGRVFDHGVSVGAGSASKEMSLLTAGLVQRFTIYELSPDRIRAGRAAADNKGLGDRISFIEGDAFAADIQDGTYDLVHWNNALHHMFDVDAAIEWSRRILKMDGLFFMDDYVGPNRFQWSQSTLALASQIRRLLPEGYLTRETDPDQQVPVDVRRPSVQRIIREDPSEAPDSERILDSLARHFPRAFVIPTGGAIYNLALTHTLHHFNPDDARDNALLKSLMLLDEAALSRPDIDTHYAVAFAWRSGKKIKLSATSSFDPEPSDSVPPWKRLLKAVLPEPVQERLVHFQQVVTQQIGSRPPKLAVDSAQGSKAPESTGDPETDGETAADLIDPEGSFQCPLCESRLKGFLPGGPKRRPNAKCPSCGALERHRAAWVYLRDHAHWLKEGDEPVRLLHIAPETPLEQCFRKFAHVDYLSADLEPGRAMLEMDLTATGQPDQCFDVIFCSHVLEHIPDDVAAMRELHRIVRAGGEVYIQVPLRGPTTYEDPAITTPEGRLEAFGQEDHVRLYGMDIRERLQAAGLEVELVYPTRDLPEAESKAINAGRGQCLIVCTRPVAARSTEPL
ncbi:MAG: alginate lyase family protein [Xanthomonadales bacterium]|nr:alginate lyase family protein [Xanthomonadales bacterium]